MVQDKKGHGISLNALGIGNMKINLSVKDRLTITTIAPSTGSIAELMEMIELLKTIKFSDEEKEEIGFKQSPSGVVEWDVNKASDKEFNINLEQIRIIKDTIKLLDENKKITLSMLDTCLKFNKL